LSCVRDQESQRSTNTCIHRIKIIAALTITIHCDMSNTAYIISRAGSHTCVNRVTAPGVILEVAVVKCGSEAGLTAAVSRGAIIKATNDKGIELYYFPEESFGETEKTSKKTETRKQKAISPEMYARLENELDKFGWRIESSDIDIANAVSQGGGM
jgi:hypothetical protein